MNYYLQCAAETLLKRIHTTEWNTGLLIPIRFASQNPGTTASRLSKYTDEKLGEYPRF